MQFPKGSIVSPDFVWYVVVKQVGDRLYCICDNANNIYGWEVKDIRNYLTLEEVGRMDWEGHPREIEDDYLARRPIPYSVIVEVLSGRHDNRFNHWSRP